MKTVLEIEASIKQLPISDARQLAGWLNGIYKCKRISMQVN